MCMNLSEYVNHIQILHFQNVNRVRSTGYAYDLNNNKYWYDSVEHYHSYVKDFIFFHIAKGNLVEDISVIKLLKEKLDIQC